MEIPDTQGRPPNSKEIKVLEGFDGRTPDEAAALVRSNHEGSVHPQQEAWLNDVLKDIHKAFTLHLWNVFVPGSPHQQRLKPFTDNSDITVLGLASAAHPHALRVTPRDGSPSRYFTVGDFGFEERSSLPYETVMEADVRLTQSSTAPAGEVRPIRYPKWSVPGLARVATITEV
ncbi:MAG: hypothetical protein ACT4TC_19805 [Myxococcaceae bacterium]